MGSKNKQITCSESGAGERAAVKRQFNDLSDKLGQERLLRILHLPIVEWQQFREQKVGLRPTVTRRLNWLGELVQDVAKVHSRPEDIRIWFARQRKPLFRQSPEEVLVGQKWLPEQRDVRRVRALATALSKPEGRCH